jgi:Ca2+-binding RTX toxin-like protein
VRNGEFIERVYQNAFGHAPSLAEYSNYFFQLSSGAMTRAAILNAVSESAEHIWSGNDHETSNNFVIDLQQGIVNGYVGEIITQKDVATTLVKRLFDSILEREPTAEEIDTWVQDLLAWGSSPPGTASGIMGGQNLGATTLDFVKRIMANTLNSIPSLSIVQQWASAIDSGGLYAKEDFVVALALSDDHIAAGDSPTLTSAVTYTLPDNTFLNLTLTGTDAINGTGNASDNIITGNSANNSLSGAGGNDTLDGGAGNDSLRGGAGNDTYMFGLGSGQDTINNSDGGTDRILLGAGIPVSALTFSKVSNNLQIAFSGVSDTLSVTNWFVGSSNQVSSLVLDGVDRKLKIGSINNDTLAGTTGNDWIVGLAGTDSIQGNAGNDVLDGGAGNDTLTGGTGYDTYVFARGGGQDSVVNGAAGNPGASGELDFAQDIAKNQLWLTHVGNDLVVSVMGSTDQVTISNWYSSSTAPLQEIKAASGWEIDSGVAQLVQAMATYSANNPGFNPASVTQAPSDTTLQNAIAAAWHQ